MDNKEIVRIAVTAAVVAQVAMLSLFGLLALLVLFIGGVTDAVDIPGVRLPSGGGFRGGD